MLALPVVETETQEIPISRLSIYAGQQDALKEYAKRVPLVQASAWRAPDGKLGLAIANIAGQPQSAVITLDAIKHGLPKAGRFYALGETNAIPLGEFNGSPVKLKLELAPLDARVLELRPE